MLLLHGAAAEKSTASYPRIRKENCGIPATLGADLASRSLNGWHGRSGLGYWELRNSQAGAAQRRTEK
jgi:hypothetical protein